MKLLINFILDLILPTHCIRCRARGPELCIKCSNALPYPEKEDRGNIFASFQYHDPIIKKLLHSLKYYKKKNIGIILGQYMYNRLIEEISELRTFSLGTEIVLIPVPITNKRYKERGYNQAEIIALGLIESNNEKIFKLEKDVIFKIKDTLPQARINNRNKRLKNIVDCFAIKNAHKIKNKTVIVVDDITTTGGTINEVIKILKNSGCKKVVGFAVAH